MEIEFPLKNIINIRKKKYNKCPTCKKSSTSSYIPFCSKKCSDIDLMKWLSDDKYLNNNK